MKQQKHSIPNKYICPISDQMMTDPVATHDGYVFQRESIENWLNQGQDLENFILTANENLKTQIQEFKLNQNQQKLMRSLEHIKSVRKLNQPFKKSLRQFEQTWLKFQRKFRQHEKVLHEIIEKQDNIVQTEEGTYKGQIIEEKKDGQGLIEYKNGDKYFGEWKDDKIQGLGKKYVHMDNLYYFGQWKNQKLNGLGCIRPRNKKYLILYKGYWENNKKHGLGISFDQYENLTYKGQFKGNKKHGKGIQIIKDGDIYEGNWISDEKDGAGMRYKQDGSIVTEFWVNGVVVEKKKEDTTCQNCLLM